MAYELNRADVAYKATIGIIEQEISQKRFEIDSFEILIVAFKLLDELKLYAKSKKDSKHHYIKSFQMKARSGTLGPKLVEGDKQTPEGLYYINRFNPKSKYHLSLGINYPNIRDKQLGRTGSDIFIHGGTETVGCIPLGDEEIEELFTWASISSQNGQTQIPVFIFPFPINDDRFIQVQNSLAPSHLEHLQSLNCDLKKLI